MQTSHISWWRCLASDNRAQLKRNVMKDPSHNAGKFKTKITHIFLLNFDSRAMVLCLVLHRKIIFPTRHDYIKYLRSFRSPRDSWQMIIHLYSDFRRCSRDVNVNIVLRESLRLCHWSIVKQIFVANVHTHTKTTGKEGDNLRFLFFNWQRNFNFR